MHWLNLETAFLNVLLLWILTTPHEFAHAWVATRLGDDTPRLQGRLTLNPLAHVDWIGTTLLPFATSFLGAGLLGWGRPVYSDPRKLRWGLNGLAIVALAGPLSNVAMAVIMAVLSVATLSAIPALAQFLAHGVELSLYLAIINMLPFPPLDGSKLLLAARLPAVVYMELSRFGFVLLIVLISATRLGILMSDWSYEGTRAIFSVLRPFA
jgi:Zn-dependent protease